MTIKVSPDGSIEVSTMDEALELQRRIRLLDLLTYAKGPSAKAGQTINIVHSPPSLVCQKTDAEASEGLTAFSSYKLSDTLQGNPSANAVKSKQTYASHNPGRCAHCLEGLLRPGDSGQHC